MDWTEKSEHKKKIRKMAYRMLWADFKDVVLGWKVFLVFLLYFGFMLMPYIAKEEFNFAGFYYFVMWVILALNALAEVSFNYLPMSTKDIVYYMKTRTNHQIGWLVFGSGVSGALLDAFGVNVFWERGLMILLFLLITVEWSLYMTLQGYSKPQGVSFGDDKAPVSRKVRIVIYHVYSLIALFGSMIVGMFMKDNENAKTKLVVFLCVYLVMLIFRVDAASWVRFDEYSKAPNRNMWGNTQTVK